MLTKIFSISTQSFNIETASASVRYLVEAKSLIQYFVSDASFKAMLILDTKSGVLSATLQFYHKNRCLSITNYQKKEAFQKSFSNLLRFCDKSIDKEKKTWYNNRAD